MGQSYFHLKPGTLKTGIYFCPGIPALWDYSTWKSEPVLKNDVTLAEVQRLLKSPNFSSSLSNLQL